MQCVRAEHSVSLFTWLLVSENSRGDEIKLVSGSEAYTMPAIGDLVEHPDLEGVGKVVKRNWLYRNDSVVCVLYVENTFAKNCLRDL